MSGQVTITQLPLAGAITGTEAVPIVQNGQTVQTTASAIAGAGALNYPFLTVGSTAGLSQARYLAVSSGLSLTDGGAGGTLQISLTGAAASLNSAGTGIQVKTGANTVTARSLAVGGGLSITDADGVSGNPTISLGAVLSGFASLTGTGILAMQSGTPAKISILGTSSQTTVTNGNGASDVTIGLANNPILPGTASVTVPIGTTAQRGTPVNGMFRYNTDTATFEGYANNAWGSITVGTGVTSINTGTGLLGGPITSTGTISIDTSVVATLNDTQTLTNKTINGPDNNLTNIGNASLTNSSITINGSSVSLGGSVTVTATASQALTIGTGLSGTSYNGSSAVTIAIDSTVVTLTGTQTLTNKTLTSPAISTIVNTGTLTLPTSTDTLVGRATTDTLTNKSMSGSLNTFTNIPNSALTNNSITLGTTNIALGGTSLAPVGLTSVTVTQNPTTDFQLATKQYVDNLVATGTTYHNPVYVESPDTAGNLNATYNNGTAGVGATLTNAGTQAALTIDGVLMTVGKRVLIYNQTNQFENGIYTVTVVGDGSTNWVLTRATDADTYGPGPDALDEGSTFYVQAGNTGAGELYTCTTVGTITFGTTAITFAQIGSTQIYSAGTGLTLSGTQFSLTSPVTAALGGTGLSSYTTGDLLYATGTTTIAKLGIGTSNQILTSTGSAPQWSSSSSITVGTATNAVNTGITADSTNATRYLTFVSATTGNLPELVNSSITCNPSTGQITGGIAGGSF